MVERVKAARTRRHYETAVRQLFAPAPTRRDHHRQVRGITRVGVRLVPPVLGAHEPLPGRGGITVRDDFEVHDETRGSGAQDIGACGGTRKPREEEQECLAVYGGSANAGTPSPARHRS